MIPNTFSVEIRSIVWTTLNAVLHHCTWMRFITFWIAKHPAFRFRVHSTRVTSDHFRLGLRSRSHGTFWKHSIKCLCPPLPGIPLFLNLFNFIEEHSQLLVVLSQALFALWSSVFSRSWGLEHLLLLQAHANELLIIIFHHHPPDYSTEFITRPAAHWSSYDKARCTPPRKCDGTTLCT